MTDSFPALPGFYRAFFLYIEPISAIVGAFYAGIRPREYLTYLASSSALEKLAQSPTTPTLISLYQLSNLYLLFALNEHLVLSSTTSTFTLLNAHCAYYILQTSRLRPDDCAH